MNNGKMANTPNISEVLTAENGVNSADIHSVEAKNNLNTSNPHMSWEQNLSKNPEKERQPIDEFDFSKAEQEQTQSIKAAEKLQNGILAMPPNLSADLKPNTPAESNTKLDFKNVLEGIKNDERELEATGNAAAFVEKIMNAREAYQDKGGK